MKWGISAYSNSSLNFPRFQVPRNKPLDMTWLAVTSHSVGINTHVKGDKDVSAVNFDTIKMYLQQNFHGDTSILY